MPISSQNIITPAGDWCPLAVTSLPSAPTPPPWLWARTDPLYISLDLPILNVSYKQNHTIHDLLCLASFRIMFSRSIPVMTCLHLSFLFMAEQCCTVSTDHDSFLHPSVDGPFGCVCFSVVMHRAAMDVCVRVFEYLQFLWTQYKMPVSATAVYGGRGRYPMLAAVGSCQEFLGLRTGVYFLYTRCSS